MKPIEKVPVKLTKDLHLPWEQEVQKAGSAHWVLPDLAHSWRRHGLCVDITPAQAKKLGKPDPQEGRAASSPSKGEDAAVSAEDLDEGKETASERIEIEEETRIDTTREKRVKKPAKKRTTVGRKSSASIKKKKE